jgi:anti-sigma B factor antagonist
VKLNRREERGVVIFDMEGKILGGDDSASLRREFEKALREKIPKLILNLKDVPWLNSSGLGVLLSGYVRLKEQGGEVKFMNPGERVHAILVTTKLDQVLEVFDDEEKAIESFTSRGSRPVERA